MNLADTRQSPLDMPAEFLKGVGPRRAEALRSMNILTLRDLLEFCPRRYLDYSDIRYIRDNPMSGIYKKSYSEAFLEAVSKAPLEPN